MNRSILVKPSVIQKPSHHWSLTSSLVYPESPCSLHIPLFEKPTGALMETRTITMEPKTCSIQTWPTVSTGVYFSKSNIILWSIFSIFFFNLSHFTVQMDRCLFLVQALPCLAGTHHQEKLCPVSWVLTALRVISMEAASQSHRYSKYFPPPFKYLKTILKDIFRKHLSGSKFILLTHSQASH